MMKKTNFTLFFCIVFFNLFSQEKKPDYTIFKICDTLAYFEVNKPDSSICYKYDYNGAIPIINCKEITI